MKERPILFNGPMVKAILDGRKTQTRRIVKPQASNLVRVNGHTHPAYITADGEWYYRDPDDWSAHDCQYRLLKCPFGQVGEQLWVKETYCRRWVDDGFAYNDNGNLDPSCCYYRADRVEPTCVDGDGFQKWNKDGSAASPWRPSIFMPRWASRIQLEVVNVRVERLQDISKADAIAEGGPPSHPSIDAISREIGYADDFSRSWYAQLWDSINGKTHPWASNPFVWVIEFKRVEVPRG